MVLLQQRLQRGSPEEVVDHDSTIPTCGTEWDFLLQSGVSIQIHDAAGAGRCATCSLDRDSLDESRTSGQRKTHQRLHISIALYGTPVS